ncbi:PDZ domain-containing protein [Virgibacillus halodenitrificans]|uniref:PDZ domain-containing protein n=1 Tax=Virgibacillus halodenitrificans TaxID=1482 RepID=A0AAC9J1C4_VIRHA|nr:PDZ domain-containing protein [Virgibacillus halodenitrificans]APC49125.1 hypothetical protein BME96_13375 [Virgibacillus halodenitrificans]
MNLWAIELGKGLAKLFLQPLLYWSLFLVVLAGYRRIKQERKNFGIKIFDVFSEWKNTLFFSLLLGVIFSVIFLGTGMVLSYEVMFIISIVIILLSITGKFTLLSPSYTIGLTYVILLFLPFLGKGTQPFSDISFSVIVILLGIGLIAEGALIWKTRKQESYPELIKGSRGGWIGLHRLKKLSIIPFFTLVPSGLITPFAPYWPYFSIGETTYSLVLFPLLIGFEQAVLGNAPANAARRLAKQVILLGVFILVLAIGSVFQSWFSLAAVVLSILGRELINYRFRTADRLSPSFFQRSKAGLKVLAIIPETPAERLEILPGEVITKVNGFRVSGIEEFYYSLQKSGAFFKLEIIDFNGENRFVQGALYEGDHHELGVVFAADPYRKKRLLSN